MKNKQTTSRGRSNIVGYSGKIIYEHKDCMPCVLGTATAPSRNGTFIRRLSCRLTFARHLYPNTRDMLVGPRLVLPTG